MQEDEKQDRYPGIKAFEKSQGHLFFGRDIETKELYKLLVGESIVILFAKSGLGKSSILRAGLSPLLEKKCFLPIHLRVQTVAEKENQTPLSIIKINLKQFSNKIKNDSYEKSGERQDRLWEYLKSCSFPLNFIPVFIFDQFEEFFSNALEVQNEFLSQLREVIHGEPPNRVLEWYKKIPIEERTMRDIDWCKQPGIKVVVAIREDRFGELNSIGKIIPGILRNRFKLEPLSIENAYQAIINPAKIKSSNYNTLPFKFHINSLDTIIKKLSGGKQFVETTQLQIVCNQIEKIVKAKQEQVDAGDGVTVTPDFFGGEKGLEEIINNFYERQISRLITVPKQQQLKSNRVEGSDFAFEIPDVALQNCARELIETKMVHNGKRILLSEDQLKDFLNESIRIFISQSTPIRKFSNTEIQAYLNACSDYLIEQLLDLRLIRGDFREGERIFEISHDSLLSAINTAIEKRNIAIEKRKTEAEKLRLLKEAEEKEKVIIEERNRAEKEKLAKEQAQVLKAIAEQEKARAEEEKRNAEELKIIAELEKSRAQEQTTIAEQQKKVAEELKELAEKQKAIAEQEKDRAEEEKRKSEVLKIVAEQERNSADQLRVKARRRSIVTLVIGIMLIFVAFYFLYFSGMQTRQVRGAKAEYLVYKAKDAIHQNNSYLAFNLLWAADSLTRSNKTGFFHFLWASDSISESKIPEEELNRLPPLVLLGYRGSPSPDGKTIISYTKDSTLYIWSVKDSVLQKNGEIKSVREYIPSGSYNRIVLRKGLQTVVWDVERNAAIGVLNNLDSVHKKDNRYRRFNNSLYDRTMLSSNGERIAYLDSSNQLRIGTITDTGISDLPVKNIAALHQVERAKGLVSNNRSNFYQSINEIVSFSPDGKKILYFSYNKKKENKSKKQISTTVGEDYGYTLNYFDSDRGNKKLKTVERITLPESYDFNNEKNNRYLIYYNKDSAYIFNKDEGRSEIAISLNRSKRNVSIMLNFTYIIKSRSIEKQKGRYADYSETEILDMNSRAVLFSSLTKAIVTSPYGFLYIDTSNTLYYRKLVSSSPVEIVKTIGGIYETIAISKDGNRVAYVLNDTVNIKDLSNEGITNKIYIKRSEYIVPSFDKFIFIQSSPEFGQHQYNCYAADSIDKNQLRNILPYLSKKEQEDNHIIERQRDH